MFERWLEALREVNAERMAHVINELRRRAVAIVFFSSRARGDNTPLSDWDLLAIVPTGEYRVEVVSIGQVVGYRWISWTMCLRLP
jgi:predicted nucleotidyltransferase